MEEFSGNMQEVAANADQIAAAADSARKAAGTGREVGERARDATDTSDELVETVQQLERSIAGIEEVLEVIDDVESKISELRSEREALDEIVNNLQTVIQFNEEMLDGTSADIAAALHEDDSRDFLTDQLVDDQVVCWTCGSSVDSDSIEETLGRLRDIRQTKLQERREVQSQLDDLKTEKATHEERKRQRSQIQTHLGRTENELDQRRERVEELTKQHDRLQERIEDPETEVEDRQDSAQSELLDLHREANEIEFELGQLEDDLESVTAEIDWAESELESYDDFQARREEIGDEIESLRTCIERAEREVVEQFNNHMEIVLEILDYDNLERIWIERKEQAVSQ